MSFSSGLISTLLFVDYEMFSSESLKTQVLLRFLHLGTILLHITTFSVENSIKVAQNLKNEAESVDYL